jgi:oligosaccharide repeat unit polymerase
MLVATFLGFFTKNKFQATATKIEADLVVNTTFAAICAFFALEFLYNGLINNQIFLVPIISIFAKTGYHYQDFTGLFGSHILLVTFSIFYAIYLFHQYLSTKKIKLLIFYLTIIALHLSIMSRGQVLWILLGSLFVFLQVKNKIKLKLVGIIVIAAIVGAFIFGYLGNNRSYGGSRTQLAEDTAVTQSFKDNIIPYEYYWSYIYVASPLANFQHNVDCKNPDVSSQNIACLFKYEITPAFVAKKLDFYDLDKCDDYKDLIYPFLNVSTAFASAYSIANWWGPILLFLSFLAIAIIYLLILPKNSPYYVTGLSILLYIFLFMPYDNAWIFTGISFQLIYPLVYSLIWRTKQRKLSRNAGEELSRS